MLLGDLELNVIDTGANDPALVFLHYWGGSSRTWQQLTNELETRYRCVTYDQRGWGSSNTPSTPYDLAALANDAENLIDALGLTRYVLVGHSMGGKAAQLLASRRPAGLKALILVAPASPSSQHIPEEGRQAQLHAYDNRDTATGAARFLTSTELTETQLEHIIEDSLAGSMTAKHAWPESIAYEDITAQVGNIAVPTLILVGDQDRQDPEEQQRTEVLPLIRGSRLEVIAHCGHLIPVDQPKALATAIEMFVTSLVESRH